MIREILGFIFICIGIGFDFLGVLGLLRLPDIYNRLQAATKCVTFGSAGILFGVFIQQGFNSFGFKALFGIAFIFLTSPVAAHAIARASHRRGFKLTDESIIDEYKEDNELHDLEKHVNENLLNEN